MKTRINSWFTKGAFLCLLAVQGLSPWLHGVELAWEQALITTAIVTGLILLILGKPSFFCEIKTLRKPLFILLLWLLYLGIYLIPIPMELLSILSPKSAEFYQLNADTNYGYLSLSPASSAAEWFELSSLVLLFLLTYALLKRPNRLSTLVYSLIIVATATAVYSLVNHYTGGQYELSKAIPPWDADWKITIRGTFSYKNQYAIYIAICIPLLLGLTFDDIKKRKKNLINKQEIQILFNLLFSRIFVSFCIALLLFFILTKTDSRGGNLVFLLIIFGTFIKYLIREQISLSRKKTILSAFMISTLLIIIFANSSSFNRFKNKGFTDSERIKLYTVAKQVILDFPTFGSGPGTYPYIQHYYKPITLGNSEMSKRAHSDYLETLATQGIIGMLIYSIAILLMLKKIFMGKCTAQPGLLMGCQASLLMLLIHSSFDYNVATFYLSALFFTLLAIGLRLVQPTKHMRHSC